MVQNYSFFNKWGRYGNGVIPSPVQFNGPYGIAIDRYDHVFVSDSYNDRILKFSNSGRFMKKWGGRGSIKAKFISTHGIAMDRVNDELYVADGYNHRIQVFDLDGNFLRLWGNPGTAKGFIQFPMHIAIADINQGIYVSDAPNSPRIQVFDRGGNFQFGLRWNNNSGAVPFHSFGPFGFALDRQGDNLYVIDSYNHRVLVYSSNGNYITDWGTWGAGRGQFKIPIGVTVDNFGDVYVSEFLGGRVQKFDSNGHFITKFGSPGHGDGEFDLPTAMSIDSAQKVYVIDQNHNRIQVFRDSNAV